MCGFVVSTSKKLSNKEFLQGVQKIKKRGPDKTEILEIDNGLFAFHRLSIMDISDSGMQPFEIDGSFSVTNGEIYNFRQLKESLRIKYDFLSTSDCEIILPLYKEKGLEAFKMLDAEFVTVIYDKDEKEFIAARDPIGIRPMFYGYSLESQEIIFSSEAKAIINLVTKVYPFPPGHYYYKGEFIQFSDVTDIIDFHSSSKDETLKSINKLLTKGVLKRLDSDAPVGFLLSGGLDSSLVCSIAQSVMSKPIKTFSIGMDTDPIDLKYAKIVADYLGTDHTEVRISQKDIIDSLEEVIYALETYDITTIRASIGMYLISKYINKNTDIKVLLTGEVSDELFGYKYTDFAPNADEFQKESIKRVRELYMYDVLRADRCLASNSLEARVPFGDIEFVNYILSINPEHKMNKKQMGKYLLRKAFEGDYLPDEILYRDKAAFSDAVGHSLVDHLKDYAERVYTDTEFEEKVKQYDHARPFTKESLLYREIFEKYYKGHSHLVSNYWMPNKTWTGCQVDDPSARVLTNYGNSGK
ncbi:asparagine synthase B [Mycoplasmatota bacterium]|nr:asparagine synthase B [Mycoplasmatota bacterium]